MDSSRDELDTAHTLALRLRRVILTQLGLASASLVAATTITMATGCSASPPDSDDGGVTTNPGSGASSSAEAEAEAVTGADDLSTDSGPDTDADTGPDTDSDDGGVKLDVEFKLDVPPQSDCWTTWLDEQTLAETHPDCSVGPFDPNLYIELIEVCVDRPPGGDCADICPPDQLCEGMTNCYWGEALEQCGVYEGIDSCCMVLAGEPPPPIGRPFWVAGAARLAEVQGPDAPDACAASDASSDPLLARHWLEFARGEHASIAAFARFVVSLQRFGAPARLVAEALAAAADEARHTQLTLALASRFARRPRRLGGLAVDAAVAETDDLAAAVWSAVVEGCIGETLAAHEAACLAAQAQDPEVCAALEIIAADEARHATLAWRFVDWALVQAPELRGVVVAAFAQREPPATNSATHLAAVPEQLGLGLASPARRARWRELARTQLVDPCAVALLSTRPASAFVPTC